MDSVDRKEPSSHNESLARYVQSLTLISHLYRQPPMIIPSTLRANQVFTSNISANVRIPTTLAQPQPVRRLGVPGESQAYKFQGYM